MSESPEAVAADMGHTGTCHVMRNMLMSGHWSLSGQLEDTYILYMWETDSNEVQSQMETIAL